MTSTWLTQPDKEGLYCNTIRMKRPDAGSYTTCGYRREKPEVLPTIALRFMNVGVAPERVVTSIALFATSTMLLGPIAMLGSAGEVTLGLLDPACWSASCSLRPG